MRTALLALCLFLYAYRATCDIYDTDGEPVLNGGGIYYLVPVSHHESGGLGLATVGSDNSPKTVVLDTNLTNVLPVRLIALEKILILHSGLSVGINFVFPSAEMVGWIIEKEFPLGWTVKIAQTQVLGGPFRIHPAKTGYKIVYYPDRGSDGVDIGIVYSKGFCRLAVKDRDPFIFKIKKATGNSAGIVNVV